METIVYDLINSAVKRSEYLKERKLVCTRNEVLPELHKLRLEYKDEYINRELSLLGVVSHSTEGYIIVNASPGSPLLELDTKVVTKEGLIVGIIDDIIGSVGSPYYSVLGYKTVSHGVQLYYPSNASILTSLSRKKGTDASNNNDEETSEESSEDNFDKHNKVPKKIFKIFSQPPPFE
jgi:rRNA processing protein Gar1